MRLRNYQCVFVLGIVVLLAALGNPRFFSMGNFSNILRFVSVCGVLAVGQTVVILTAGIDLSVGSVLALTNCIAAGAMVWGKVPIPLVILISLAAGGATGLLSGLLVTHGKLQPFIATLAMMLIARGIAQQYSQNRPITGLPEDYAWFNGDIGGVPIPAIIFVVCVALVWLVLAKTTLGRAVYAVGGNQEASRLSGIPVNLVKWFAYALCGVTAGLAGLLHTAKINIGHPAEGSGLELDAIAAVVLGGTDLMGGRGSVLWTLVGALTLQVITTMIQINNIHPAAAKVIKGGIIVGAILLGRLIDLIDTRLAQRRAAA